MLQKTRSTHPRTRGASPRTRRALLLAGAIAATWATCGSATELYRWTDANGVRVYSQRPPPGAEATRLTPVPGPSAAERQRAEERVRSLVEQDFDRREEAKRQEQASQEERERQARRQANCEAATRNRENLENGRIGSVRSPDGEVQALTEEVRARYLEEALKVIRENCD